MGKILVVVDYQNDFVNGNLGCGFPAINIENKLYDKINDYLSKDNNRVIFTLDTHTINSSKNNENTLFKDHCIKYTNGWLPYGKIMDFFIKKAKDTNYNEKIKIIEKETYLSIDLGCYINKIIQNRLYPVFPIEEIEFVGIATNICVLHNFIYITNLFSDIKVTVDENCCASFDEKLHKDAINIMKGLYSE